MDLNKLRDEAFETAKSHGWHDEEQSNEAYLMLIITEIAEAVQADRKDKHADVVLFKADVETLDMADGYDRDVWKRDFEIFIKNTVEDELSDIVIRCLDLAALRNCDLALAKAAVDRNILMVNDELPMFAYRMCWFLADETDYSLCSRLNYCIAAVITYCQQKGIDIEWFIEQKMSYNELRPYKHGNKKY